VGLAGDGDLPTFPPLACPNIAGHKIDPETAEKRIRRDRPHVRFRSGEPGKGSKARAPPWTRQGRSPWNQPVGVCGIGLSSLHPMNRGRPEGVTRLAMCMIEGRAGWSGVEPQAQETGICVG
jgi:hypothetical protein